MFPLRFTSGMEPTNLLVTSMLKHYFPARKFFIRGKMLDLNGQLPAKQSKVQTTWPWLAAIPTQSF